MASSKKKRTPEEAMKAMREGQLDDLVDEIDAMTPEEVDRLLAEHGGDPAGTARRADAQIDAIKERSARLSWQDEARAKLAASRAEFAAVRAKRPKLPRAELLARLSAAGATPRLGAPVAAFFRKRTTAEMTDEELEALLDEVEAAREAAAKKKGEGPGEGSGP